jgi:dolichol kinase
MNKKAELDLIYRKSIHLSSLWIPFTYHFLDFFEMLLVVLFSTTVVLLWDRNRNKKNALGKFIRHINKITHLDKVLKTHEKNGLTGASLMMVSTLLCMMLFEKEIVIIALTILVVCDTLACLVGIKYGKPCKTTKKSILGSQAFFISSIIVSFPLAHLYDLPLIPLFISVMAATYFEHCSNIIEIDDNFIIPISFCITFVLCSALM